MRVLLLLARLRQPRPAHWLSWRLHRFDFAILVEDLAMELLL